MFGRRLFRPGRMFRREMRRERRAQANALDDVTLQAMQNAHRQVELGHFVEAAEIFERLGYTLQQSQMPRRAARLYLLAARNRLQGGQPAQGFPLLKHAIGILAGVQAWPALRQVCPQAVAELRQLGYTTQAGELQHWLEQSLPQLSGLPFQAPETAAPAASKVQTSRRLPGKCPYCGASLRPDEVTWIDQTDAACPYCGSAIESVN